MIKSIIKEFIIMLLLCVAIALVLGVIFYDYIPTNKAVPVKLESYKTSENVQEQIDEQITQMDKVEVTYEVTGADLKLYKDQNSYKTKKKNPFVANPVTDNNIENETNTNGTTNSSTSTNTNVDPNSVGTFFNDTGLK